MALREAGDRSPWTADPRHSELAHFNRCIDFREKRTGQAT